jgi:hypothetical protein
MIGSCQLQWGGRYHAPIGRVREQVRGGPTAKSFLAVQEAVPGPRQSHPARPAGPLIEVVQLRQPPTMADEQFPRSEGINRVTFGVRANKRLQ